MANFFSKLLLWTFYLIFGSLVLWWVYSDWPGSFWFIAVGFVVWVISSFWEDYKRRTQANQAQIQAKLLELQTEIRGLKWTVDRISERQTASRDRDLYR